MDVKQKDMKRGIRRNTKYRKKYQFSKLFVN